ncbi:MAG: DUF2911 domain-containing protein [Gemmatimonadales bacterium]|nr:MAG: DUF2911 domain-containing protein [Gemmatimonadales bacterium]
MRFLMRIVPAALSAALLTISAGPLLAQAGLRPAPSGRGTSEVVLTVPAPEGQAGPEFKIRLDYGQPHLRGRAINTDSLVPYGEPWRTGANAATTLTTDVDLDLAGVSLPKGTYVLFTLPSRTGWKLLIQRDAGQGGVYKVANDVARVDLRTRQLPASIESLTMWLIPSTAPGAARGELRMAWGTTELSADWQVK